MSVSAKEIIDEVLFKLNQNTRNPLAVTRSKILAEVNNCLVDLAENTRLFPAKSTITLATDTPTYELPNDFVEIVHLSDYTNRDLAPTTLEALKSYSWYWQNESGTPQWYIFEFDEPNTIRLFQTPSVDWNTKVLNLVYYQYQPKILYESVELPLPIQRNVKTMVDFCLSQMYKFQMEVQNEQLSQQYWSDYVGERNKWSKRSISPPRLTIMGSTGRQSRVRVGPTLPANYPPLWGWR